jgi:NAD(P)H-dependent FMN reductase
MATIPQNSRKRRALEMLTKQLATGSKTQKKTMDVKIPLTDSDKKRIQKEIDILSKKV